MRILLDDKQAVARSCCDRLCSSVLEFAFQLESLVSSHIVDDIYIQFRLKQNSTLAGPSGT